MQKLGSHHHYLTLVFQNCHVSLAGNSSRVSASFNLPSTSELEELMASAITLGNFRTMSWPSYFQTTARLPTGTQIALRRSIAKLCQIVPLVLFLVCLQWVKAFCRSCLSRRFQTPVTIDMGFEWFSRHLYAWC